MLKDVLLAMKQAVLDDETLSGVIKHVLCAQGGAFPSGAPKPVVVISPDTEAIEYARMTNDLERTLSIVIYAYAEAYGQEIGLFGIDDSQVVGVVEIGDAIENLFMHNRLDGLVRDMKVLRKTFPIPPVQWNRGLNEVRVQLEASVKTTWNPF